MLPDASDQQTPSDVPPREWSALIVAVLKTPAVPGVLIGIAGGVVNRSLVAAVFSFLAAYLVSLPIVAILGLPVFLLVRRFKLLRWWTALLAGLPFGFGVWLAISSPGTSVWGGLVFGSVGSLSALYFWLTWRKYRRVPFSV